MLVVWVSVVLVVSVVMVWVCGWCRVMLVLVVWVCGGCLWKQHPRWGNAHNGFLGSPPNFIKTAFGGAGSSLSRPETCERTALEINLKRMVP